MSQTPHNPTAAPKEPAKAKQASYNQRLASETRLSISDPQSSLTHEEITSEIRELIQQINNPLHLT